MSEQYRYGSDVPIMRRVTRRSTAPGVEGAPVESDEVSQVLWTLRRQKKSRWYNVEDHVGVSLTIADVFYDELQPWGRDTTGFNFWHTVDRTSLAPIADYVSIYNIALSDGTDVVEEYYFHVYDEFDADATPDEYRLLVTGAAGAAGAGYRATSVSSVTLTEGPLAWTTQAGLAYTVGARVRVSASASATNWAEGLVTGYSGTTLSVNVDLINGSGAFSAWNINLAGERGATGGGGSSPVSALFVQTATETVSNTTTETTLIDSTGALGTLAVGSGTYLAGDTFTITAWGVVSTKDTGAGTLTVEMALGTEVVATFEPIEMNGAQSSQPWNAKLTLTRRTQGTTGVVSGHGELTIGRTGMEAVKVPITVAPTTLPSDAAKTPNATGQWSVANASNVFTCYGVNTEQFGAPAV